MMSTPHKARKMDEERRAVLAIQRAHKAALKALPRMVELKRWLDLDTAGDRYIPLKAAAREVMDALDEVALEGAPFCPKPVEGSEP